MSEPIEVDGLEAWVEAGRKLQSLDPDRFARILAVAQATLTVYEDSDIFTALIRRANGPKINA